jgi:beta-lactamase class A
VMKLFTKLNRPIFWVFLLGLVAGWFFGHFSSKVIIDSSCKEIRAGGFQFINPLLECKGDEVGKELKPFKDKVVNLVNGFIDDKDASKIAVYFRDMNNGPWFGINENENFIPASLLKVPVMISYLKKIEREGKLLDEVIVDDKEYINNFQYVVPEQEVKVGEKHTVEDLVFRSIVYSDNIAATLLMENSKKFGISMQSIYDELGIKYTLGSDDNMNVKGYASFFRILFNASYLNAEISDGALQLLSETKFKNGIVAGVPENIKVAHKFGEKPFNNQDKQLHDCGIVYYPEHPYLLCIMSKGSDFLTLEKDIQKISKLIYDEVDAQYRSK